MRISKLQLLAFITLTIFATSILATTTTTTTTAISKNSDESNGLKTCNSLCDQCGCKGFYCGEECICECNDSDNKLNATECIKTVQDNAKKMKANFEILIQGPSGNQFLQDAQLFEQNKQECGVKNEDNREKRSTVVIYKPTTTNSLKDEVSRIQSKIEDLERAIVKRDNEDRQRLKRQLFDPFNIFSNNNNDDNIPENILNETADDDDDPKIKSEKNSLTSVDMKSKNLENESNTQVKRSFLGLGKYHLGLEPIPSCLLEAEVEIAADKFHDAVKLLKEAADDLIINLNLEVAKKSECFQSILGKKLLIHKLGKLKGLSCLEKIFPKIKLFDILDLGLLSKALVVT